MGFRNSAPLALFQEQKWRPKPPSRSADHSALNLLAPASAGATIAAAWASNRYVHRARTRYSRTALMPAIVVGGVAVNSSIAASAAPAASSSAS